MKYPGTQQAAVPRVTTADEWRKRNRDRARGKAVPLTLPSGVVIKVARPPMQTWFGTAKLPETLSRNVIDIFGSSVDEADESIDADKLMMDKVNAMPKDEQRQLVDFMNRLLLEGVVEPQLVDKTPDECLEDEFALSDLDDEERAFILFHIMSGVPSQPVPVADGGEVSMEQLDKFRDTQRGPDTGEAGGEVPPAA